MGNAHMSVSVETGIGVCECMCMSEVRWAMHT